MKKEILHHLSSNSPRMLLNLEREANPTQGQQHPSFVPEGHLRIARRFNAGLAGDGARVPKGRLTCAGNAVFRPSLRDSKSDGVVPGVETPGYYQLLLPEQDDFAPQALRFFKWSCNSARTCSQGIPRSGCCRISSERRSSSAICSGVRLSSNWANSLSTRRTNSRRSVSGNFRIWSKISVTLALIPQTDSSLPRNQARIARPIDSALR